MKNYVIRAIFMKDNRVMRDGALLSTYTPVKLLAYLKKITKPYLKKIGDDLEWELTTGNEAFITTTAWAEANYPSAEALFKIDYKTASITYEGTI